MDIDNEVQDCKFRGVREDFTTDKEQQAYASVLYLLSILSPVVLDTNIQFIRKYICKKFPALGKCVNVNDMLLLCSPESRDDLQRIAEAYKDLSWGTDIDISESDKFKFLEKNVLARVKPAHEEDLKIEKVNVTEIVDKEPEAYLVDSNGNKLASYKSAIPEYKEQITKRYEEQVTKLIDNDVVLKLLKDSLSPFTSIPSYKLQTLPY